MISLLKTSIAQHPLGPLFEQTLPNHPMLFSVLEGNNPGLAVVDDKREPTQCMLRNNEGWTFCSKRTAPAFFGDALTSLRRSGKVSLVWESRIHSQIVTPPPTDTIVDRIEFTQRDIDPALLERWLQAMPRRFMLRQMNRELLQRCLWRPNIEAVCGSLDNFLHSGLGYCLVQGDHIAAEAYAPFWGNQHAELGVVTHPEFRGHGYAAIACAHLIRQCEQRGFATYWSCNADNAPSIRVAEKLGYFAGKPYRLLIYSPLS